MNQKQTHRHKEQTCGCQREGTRKGWTGSLRLAIASYYIHLEWITTRSYSISSVAQSCLVLCNPMDCSTPGLPVHSPLSIPNSRSLLKLMSIESVMPSNHLILCSPLLLPSIFPRIRVFSKESVLHIRWPKCWSFSFGISTSNEYSRLISFRIDWFDLLAVQGTLQWYR